MTYYNKLNGFVLVVRSALATLDTSRIFVNLNVNFFVYLSDNVACHPSFSSDKL